MTEETASPVVSIQRVKRKKALVYFKCGPKNKLVLDEEDNISGHKWTYNIGAMVYLASTMAEKNIPSYANREKRILLECGSRLKVFERGTVSCGGRKNSVVSVYAVGEYAGDNNCVWVEEAIISEMTIVPFSRFRDKFEGVNVALTNSNFPCTIRVTHRGCINTKVVHPDNPKATFNFHGNSGVPPIIIQAIDSAGIECSCTLYPGDPLVVDIKRPPNPKIENAIAITSSSSEDEEEEEDKPKSSPESKKRETSSTLESVPKKTAKTDLAHKPYGCIWDNERSIFVWHLLEGKKCQNMSPHIHSNVELLSALRPKVRDKIQSDSTGELLLLWDCIKQRDVWNFVEYEEEEEEFDIPEEEEPPPAAFLMARTWDEKEKVFVWHEDEGEMCKQMPPHEHDQFQPSTELDKIKMSLGHLKNSQWWYSWEKDLYQINIDARYNTKLQHCSKLPHGYEEAPKSDPIPVPPQPPQPSDPQAATNFDCIVCMERKRSVVFLPCKHLVVCEACIEILRKDGNCKCPLCRSQVTGHLKVFI